MVFAIAKRLAALFAASGLLASAAHAQVHWTLHEATRGLDGPEAAYVTSTLGANEIKYVLPTKWTLSGSRFIPPGKSEADAFVVAVPIQAPAPWTPERAKALHDAVLSQMVPSGASEAAIVSEGATSVQIDGQSAYEICFSYAFYGEVMMESVLFIEHGKTQLQFHLGSLKDDFADLHAALTRSLLSLDGF
jgi:hypothetical protein